VIETDMEILIPSDYVNEIEERISLYKGLDDLESENELLDFESNLNDRFGQHPKQVLELFDSIRLRWIGKSLGFQKILLKSDKMICSFIADQGSPYYQSEIFTKFLSFIQSNPPGVKMYERNNGLRLSVENIKSVEDAIQFFNRIF
jgi:transcription-repair coupling factor (superfamily II helicase)